MKSERGVTLISLIVYIIGLLIAITVVNVVSSFFYKNINTNVQNIDSMVEYTKFNSFFADEVNHSNIKILEGTNNYVVFNNGVQFSYISGNQAVYRNNIKIARYVTSCNFSINIKNGKYTITVKIKIGENERTNEYTLKN